MNLSQPLIHEPLPAVAVEPTVRSFHYRAVAAQTLARLSAFACDARRDTAPPQFTPLLPRVRRLVGL
jgi:hypothetical protein